MENQIQAALNKARSSGSAAIQRLRTAGLNALMDRVDARDTAMRVKVQSMGQSLDVVNAARDHENRKYQGKIRDLEAVIKSAEDDVRSRIPALEQPQTAGGAQIDAELRAQFRAVPDDQKMAAIDKLSPAMRHAIARAPAELSGLVDGAYQRVRDTVLRTVYPAKMAELDNDREVIEAARLAHGMFKETAVSSFAREAAPRGEMKVRAA